MWLETPKIICQRATLRIFDESDIFSLFSCISDSANNPKHSQAPFRFWNQTAFPLMHFDPSGYYARSKADRLQLLRVLQKSLSRLTITRCIYGSSNSDPCRRGWACVGVRWEFLATSPRSHIWPLTRSQTLNLAVASRASDSSADSRHRRQALNICWLVIMQPLFISDHWSSCLTDWLMGLIRSQSAHPDRCNLCFYLKLL